MEELRKQVSRARRRLGLQRFFGALGWCWFATLLVATILIAVDKFFPMQVPAWGWIGGALGVGLFLAVAWMIATRRPAINAAIEIDQRFGLKERVSSTLAMPADEQETEIGQALVADAVRRVSRVDVPTKFGVVPSKGMLLPLLPGVIALAVYFLISPAVQENPVVANPTTAETKKRIKASSETLKKRLAERRKKAKEQGLKDAEALFKRLEQGTDEIAKAGDRKKTLVKLNDLSRDLEKRRKELAGADELQKRFEQLKNINRGPAGEFAKSMANGDFQKAAQEMEKLKNQLANSDLSDDQKEELANQLEKMQDKLNEMVENQKKNEENLKKQLQQAQQAGDIDKANQLQNQLNQLQQQNQQMQQMAQMADQLGQAAQAMRNGQIQDAQNALQDFQGGLQDMQQQLNEMQMLDEAMNQLAQAKQRMDCKDCGGFG